MRRTLKFIGIGLAVGGFMLFISMIGFRFGHISEGCPGLGPCYSYYIVHPALGVIVGISGVVLIVLSKFIGRNTPH